MLAAVIVVFAVVADQLSKYFVVSAANPVNGASGWTCGFIPKVLSLVYEENTGAAFSMFSDRRWVFMLFSAILIPVVIYILVKEYKRHTLLTVSLAMILGGGIGNMIDRIRLGYVVDFFKTEFVDFAIFNVADCFITVGAILLAVYVIFFESKVEKKLASEKEKAKESTENPPEEGSENG